MDSYPRMEKYESIFRAQIFRMIENLKVEDFYVQIFNHWGHENYKNEQNQQVLVLQRVIKN